MSQTKGIDISYYQGEMDAQQSYNAGNRFCFIRAGGAYTNTGSLFTDTRYHENVEKFSKVMYWGAYWFFVPFSDPIAQADYFLNLLSPYDYYLPPVIDVESNPTGMSQGAFQEAINKFINRLQTKVIVYTRASFWNPQVGNQNLYLNHDLWVARYTSANHPWEDDPSLRPINWQDWSFWQWSADGNGKGEENGAESPDIDLNWFNGDYSELEAYVGRPFEGETPPPIDPPPTDPVIPPLPRVKLLPGFSGLNIRSTPLISNYNKVGLLLQNQPCEVSHIYEYNGDKWVAVVTPGRISGWCAYRHNGTQYLEWIE